MQDKDDREIYLPVVKLNKIAVIRLQFTDD